MHELSVAQSVVELACEHAEHAGAQRVLKVRLELGLLSGVAREALEFCFSLACQGTCAEGAELEIFPQPARATCPRCHGSFELDEFMLICPGCGAFPMNLESGGDLRVDSLEVE